MKQHAFELITRFLVIDPARLPPRPNRAMTCRRRELLAYFD
jgi:hypothetical protein